MVEKGFFTILQYRILLVLALAIIGIPGLSAIAGADVNRISGRGYFYPVDTSYKASFSFNVNKDGAGQPSGWVKFRLYGRRMKMASTSITDLSFGGIGNTATFSGNCKVNRKKGFTFSITVSEGNPDTFKITIKRRSGRVYYSAGPRDLIGGDLVIRDTVPPLVRITSPANLTTVGSSPTTVSGAIDDPNATLTINSISATITNGEFTVPDITISEGMNTIVARAVDPANNVSTTSINISLDSTPPHIAITSPSDGYKSATSPITVTGIINDIVRGTVNESQGNVLVNGVLARVSNRNFIAESVPLQTGSNAIKAVGADQWGNIADDSITVTLDSTPRAVINIISGNNQSGPIGTTLSDPLVVSLTDENGAPISGGTVIFRVTENNGILHDGSSEGRAIVVTSNADGQAQVNYTLGTWAGAGNNKVKLTATGIEGSVTLTASGTQGDPANIYVAQGNQQRGAISQPLPEPLVAFVTDDGYNPLNNIPVIFKVAEGGGKFPNGLDTAAITTDSDGRATTAFTLGPSVGNDGNIIGATFEGNSHNPISFTATGLIPGDAGNTQVSGIVLDNSNNPVSEVTVRVEGTTREGLTDTNGQFVIKNVPVGPVHLIVDGGTAGTPGIIEYPTLIYELSTVAGANNNIGMPIYLLPLDLANARWVGGDEDVTYTIPGVTGFSLTIKARSATFPDGKNEGYVSVTRVHADKVPMVPQIGQQPRFIITIQPPGVVFDPPARLTLPNTDSLEPGEKTNLYSFDHDLGIFVSIGSGTVSEDGSVIVSDPGVGVVKAGWHCGGNPATTGSCNNCSECQTFADNRCVPEPDGKICKGSEDNFCGMSICKSGACVYDTTELNGASCDDKLVCTENDKCTDGECKGEKKPDKTGPGVSAPSLNLDEGLKSVNSVLKLFFGDGAPQASLQISGSIGTVESCCEKLEGKFVTNKKAEIGGSAGISGEIPIPGLAVQLPAGLGKIGLFGSLGLSESGKVSVKEDNCEETYSGEASLQVSGTIGVAVKGETPKNLVSVSVKGETGLTLAATGEVTKEMINFTGTGKHNGLVVTAEAEFFDGLKLPSLNYTLLEEGVLTTNFSVPFSLGVTK